MATHEYAGRRAGRLFVLVFIILAAGIVTAAYLYYRDFENRYRAEVEHKLKAVADLKVDDLTQWRKERLGDARVVSKNAAFAAMVRRLIEAPGNTEPRGQLLAWLTSIQEYLSYHRLLLLDAQGVLLMSVPETSVPAAAIISERAREVLRSRQVTFLDFYRNEHDQRVYLAVLVPIFDEPNGGRPLGTLVLHIDPETYLYPLIARWPTPSPTAESLLVRRDGDDAMFLNELRFQKHTALNLRASLKEEHERTSVKAVLGQEGIVEGKDYRGVPVVSALRRVPDSPWFLVARMDASEIHAPARERLWGTVAFVIVLLAGAGASVGFVRRREALHAYETRLAVAETLVERERELQKLIKCMINAFVIFESVFDDDDAFISFRFVAINDAYERIVGVKNEEVAGKTIHEVWPDTEPEWVRRLGEVAVTGVTQAFEQYHAPTKKLYHCSVYRPWDTRDRFCVILEDITERKRVEAELVAATQLRQTVIDHSQYLFYAKDLEGRFVLASRSLAELFGQQTHEQLLGKTSHDFLPKAVADRHRANDLEVAARQSILRIEETVETQDGLRTFLSTKFPLFDAEERMYAVCGASVDITERKRAEEALRESETMLREAQTIARMGRWELDLITSHLAWSDGIFNMFEVSRETSAASYEAFLGFVHPDDRVLVDQAYRESVESKKPYEIEHRLLMKDGRIKWVNEIGRTDYDDTGHPTRSVGTVQDITERKRAEEALRESEQRFRSYFELPLIGVCITSPAKGWLEVNDRVCTLLGYDRAELAGLPWVELTHPDDLAADMAQFNRVLQDEIDRYQLEKRFIRKNGEVVVVDLAVGCVRKPDRTVDYFVALLQDITQRKQQELALREKNDELARFTYTVSHDLKSPLVTIKTFLGFLENDVRSQDAPRVEKDMAFIHTAADKMSRLLDELLELSRVGRKMNPFAEVPLQVIVKDALDLVAGRIVGRGAEVQVTEEPVLLYGDQPRLVELFQNLVDNAVKFMGDQPAPRVEIGVQRTGAEEVLFVRDNGIGIDPRHQGKLFGLFEKLDPAAEGTGMGLALVRRIVEVHGGRIWVESAGPGKGTTFHFTLAARGGHQHEEDRS